MSDNEEAFMHFAFADLERLVESYGADRIVRELKAHHPNLWFQLTQGQGSATIVRRIGLEYSV